MRRIELKLQFLKYEATNELDVESRSLLDEARKSMPKAYAPYSGFRVGAAVLLANGKAVSGSNQENGAYPSGLCAERVAVFSAHAQYPGTEIKAVAIVADTERFQMDEPVYPCGACRQVLLEFENKQNKNIRVIMGGPQGSTIESSSVADLLPLQFSGHQLKKEQS